MTRKQAKELVELLESCQWEEAKLMVESLVDPREDELRFTIVRDGRVTEARVIEPQPRDVEERIASDIVNWAKQEQGREHKEFKVYRSTLHGTYELHTTARRK